MPISDWSSDVGSSELPGPAGSARGVGTKSRSDAAFCLGAGWARRGRGGGCATGGACDGDRHGLGGADDEKSDSDEVWRGNDAPERGIRTSARRVGKK